ncbi:hypothetical protein [Streptomyces ureilyticus]|uniref:hypothetical protein n=1 Tax=Streptomyces ureilyticus TaxID=1775131 RepID=UPI002E2D5AD6|nr:hypothetical protein [Streptomyces ureilyticus]
MFGGDIIVRTHRGAALAAHVRDTDTGTVVLYEAYVIEISARNSFSLCPLEMSGAPPMRDAIGRDHRRL